MSNPDPLGWAGIARWMDTEQEAFRNYLSTLQTAEQQALIASIHKPRSLGQVAEFLNAPTTAPETKRYITEFLAKLPPEQMVAQRAKLATVTPRLPPRPSMPTADPVMSAELQKLLGQFGVDYPKAPAPTPALLAYLRGVGSSLSTAEDLKRRAVEQIGMRATAATQDVQRQSDRGKQALTSDLIRRNVLSSGESNTRYARHAEDLGEARSNIERERVSGVTQAVFAFQQSRDAARQQALERTLGVDERQQSDFAQANAQYEAMLAQTRAADAAWARERKAMEDSIKRQEELMRQYASSGVVL